MLKLLLTADYEIFGNGSGDIEPCLLGPTEKLLSIAEKHGTRVTLFADVCEIWSFEESRDTGILPDYCQSATLIRKQLKDAILRGHDVQLHAHPQWLGARWNCDDKKWNLRMDRWRIGSLLENDIDGDGATPEELITRGRKWLEKLLQPIDPTYVCRAFRAGGWSIQPEGAVLRALTKAGLLYETSVAPGMYYDDGLSYFDFRGASGKMSTWPITDSVSNPQRNGPLIEVPILTMQNSIMRAVIRKLRRRPKVMPVGCTGVVLSESRKRSMAVRYAKALFTRHGRTQMLDFCDLSADEMFAMVKYASYVHSSPGEHPIVAIGHPKSFGSPDALDGFLELCSDYTGVRLELLNEMSFWRAT